MSIITKLEQLNAKINNDKTLLASAITNKGIGTASTESLSSMAAKISQIEQGGGGSLEPGAEIPYDKIISPSENIVLPLPSSKGLTRFCIDTGDKIIFTNSYSYYLYSFDKVTKTTEKKISSYIGFTNCYIDNDKYLFVRESGSTKYVIITDTNFEILQDINLTSTVGSIFGYSKCVEIVKIGDNYYLLFGYSSAASNVLVKVSSTDYSCTGKTVNSITSGSETHCYGMIVYNNNLYVLSRNALAIISPELELVKTTSSIGAGDTYNYSYQMYIKDDILIVNKYGTSGIYKVDPNELTISETINYTDRSSYDVMYKIDDYVIMVYNGSIKILDINLNYITTINIDGKFTAANIVDGKLLIQDASNVLYLYDNQFKLLWSLPYSYDNCGTLNGFDSGNYITFDNKHRFADLIDNDIYLFRNSVVSVKLNPVYTIK